MLFWASVAVFAAAVPMSMLYVLGYRLDENFTLQKTGGLYISSPVAGSEISIDKKIVKRTSILQSGIFIQSLRPRAYKISVKKEGYRAWEKELRVLPQSVTEARALLVPEEPNAEVRWRGKFDFLASSPFEPVFLLVEEREKGNFLTFYLPEPNEFVVFEPSDLLAASPSFKKDFELMRWRQGGAVVKLDGKIRRLSFDLSRRVFAAVLLGSESPQKTETDAE
ncbi:MAG: PEGA domain-containing protein, partial [Patescibacteria group bacterium]